MRNRTLIFGLFALIAFQANPGIAQTVVLYDGAVAGKPLPGDWGWVWLTDPLFTAKATRSADSGGVLMESTAVMGDSAGYFGNLLSPPPNLDHAAGFTVRFDAVLIEETHDTDHRAGFSVIVITDDVTCALELGFWTDEVWAQSDSPIFNHGEGAALDTTVRRTYAVFVRGDRYVLFADGSAVLSGVLKNYSTFGAPYDIPNFLFFGDDTSSAAARSQVFRFDLIPHTPGDLDGIDGLTLTDAVIALQVLAGMTPPSLAPDYALRGADVDLDFRVGMPEVLYILGKLANL